MEKLIYLDTHVVVWLFSLRLDLFSENARNIIEQNDLLISPIVELELQYLLEIERIREAPLKIINLLAQNIGLQICSKNFPAIVQKSLEFSWARDPFDRIITAQAATTRSRLLTKDASILANYDLAVWE